jgi:RNA polymerase sigma factor (sigma-70 family)
MDEARRPSPSSSRPRLQPSGGGAIFLATVASRATSDTAVNDQRETLEAFEAWYRAEHPRLLAALTVACGNGDIAQDATAEAFARALAAWGRVGAMETPAGWTYRVGVNVLRRQARRVAIEARLLRRVVPATIATPTDDNVELWDAVRALPKRERLAIALRYAGGLPEADVAAAMGVAVGTASATLTSARRRLARALADDESEDSNG